MEIGEFFIYVCLGVLGGRDFLEVGGFLGLVGLLFFLFFDVIPLLSFIRI
jgi:hypothetical protein